jgi:hypothetical protein
MSTKSDHLVLQSNAVRLMPGRLGKVGADGFALLGPGVMAEMDTSRHEEYMRPVSAEKLVYQIVSS